MVVSSGRSWWSLAVVLIVAIGCRRCWWFLMGVISSYCNWWSLKVAIGGQ